MVYKAVLFLAAKYDLTCFCVYRMHAFISFSWKLPKNLNFCFSILSKPANYVFLEKWVNSCGN